MQIVRAQVMHTPPRTHSKRSRTAPSRSRMGGSSPSAPSTQIRAAHPGAEVRDERDALLLPGLVDTHVHFPQLPIIGAMGLGLLEWLQQRALPQEARMADPVYARAVAREFLDGLAANGTTTALVFGSHFPEAQDALFEEAERKGLRIASGLVVSDRNLLPELHVDPQAAYDAGAELARRWHGRGRLRYAVTPRFSLSCTDGMLESCGALHAEVGALVTSHINESPAEVEAVAGLFEWSEDYLETYERFGLVTSSTVLAHNDHPRDAELGRLAAAGTSVAHCPESNAFLGSGLFPMRRHLDHGVKVALGTDVGAGTGFSLFKEGLMAYELQMLREDGVRLGPAELLHLATRAGALALGLADEVGDLSPGKAADFVLVRPPEGSTLAAVLRHSDSPEQSLGAIFALAREESVVEVRVAGAPVAPGQVARRGREPPDHFRLARLMADPALGEILVQRDELAHRVKELGEEVSRDYAGRQLLLIGVLKGAVFFLADLMRHLDVDCEVDFMAVSSYGASTDSSGVVRILKDLDAPIEDKHVLIVEDIVDSGLTLSYLFRMLRARHPASLEVCALLTKPQRREIELPIKYVGFEIPNRFAIGYGLDFAERYRNLPYVAVLNEP